MKGFFRATRRGVWSGSQRIHRSMFTPKNLYCDPKDIKFVLEIY